MPCISEAYRSSNAEEQWWISYGWGCWYALMLLEWSLSIRLMCGNYSYFVLELYSNASKYLTHQLFGTFAKNKNKKIYIWVILVYLVSEFRKFLCYHLEVLIVSEYLARFLRLWKWKDFSWEKDFSLLRNTSLRSCSDPCLWALLRQYWCSIIYCSYCVSVLL